MLYIVANSLLHSVLFVRVALKPSAEGSSEIINVFQFIEKSYSPIVFSGGVLTELLT